jgi:hypothetical protein
VSEPQHIETRVATVEAEVRAVATSVEKMAGAVDRLTERVERMPRAGQWNLGQIVGAFTLLAGAYAIVDARFSKVESDRLSDQAMNIRMHERSVYERDRMADRIDSRWDKEVGRNDAFSERISRIEGNLYGGAK